MMFTGPRALIDYDALRHNLEVVRRYAPDSRVWAVIKANAYGHGMEGVATALAGADGFAIARVEEGLRLRRAGVDKPLLVLEGAVFQDEVDAAAHHGLELVVHRIEQVAHIEQAESIAPLRVWIKADTGMHRLGLTPDEITHVRERLIRCERVARPLGLLTHLANADDPRDPLSEGQCERVRGLQMAGEVLSIANSAGILAVSAARTAWVRPGLMLYGASPLSDRMPAEFGLRPVMTFWSRLIAIKALRAGDAIGYGGTYICPEDMLVGVAAVGYGDGYPRHAPSGTPVLVKGRRAALLGRVSMDMINIDLRGVPDARLGDRVELWGPSLPVDLIARAAGTIPYELLCRITTRVRLETSGA